MKKFANLLVIIIILLSMFNSVLAQEENTGIEATSLAELFEKADQVFNSRKYVQSRDLYQQAADLAMEQGDSSYSTEAFSMLARTYLIEDERKEAQKYLVKAVGTASPDHPLGWSRYLGVRGRFEWHDKRFEKATETFKEMYYYCSAREIHDRAIDAAHMVGITGNFEEQVEWAKKGIKAAETGNVTSWLGPLWNNLGATYEDLKEYENALEAYEKARDYHYQYGQERNKLIADWALGHAYRLLKDVQNAEKYLKPLLKKFDDLNDVEFMGWTYKELGHIEITKKNLGGAVKYLYLARTNLKQSGMKDWDPEGYNALIQLIEDTKKIDMQN
jgi:tetratricopeptide (TPR) repeat protein